MSLVGNRISVIIVYYTLHWCKTDVTPAVLLREFFTVAQPVLKDPPPSVSLSGAPVDRVTVFKLLGVHVASDLMGLLQLRYEHDSSTIRLRFDYNTLRDAYDSSTIQHPTRSYVLSSNNEHVNSFAML